MQRTFEKRDFCELLLGKTYDELNLTAFPQIEYLVDFQFKIALLFKVQQIRINSAKSELFVTLIKHDQRSTNKMLNELMQIDHKEGLAGRGHSTLVVLAMVNNFVNHRFDVFETFMLEFKKHDYSDFVFNYIFRIIRHVNQRLCFIHAENCAEIAQFLHRTLNHTKKGVEHSEKSASQEDQHDDFESDIVITGKWNGLNLSEFFFEIFIERLDFKAFVALHYSLIALNHEYQSFDYCDQRSLWRSVALIHISKNRQINKDFCRFIDSLLKLYKADEGKYFQKGSIIQIFEHLMYVRGAKSMLDEIKLLLNTQEKINIVKAYYDREKKQTKLMRFLLLNCVNHAILLFFLNEGIIHVNNEADIAKEKNTKKVQINDEDTLVNIEDFDKSLTSNKCLIDNSTTH